MLSIKFSEPFNAQLAANGIIAGWLLQANHANSGTRIWQLVEISGGGPVSEMDLFAFFRANEPLWKEYLGLAGLSELGDEAARLLDARAAVDCATTVGQMSLLDAASLCPTRPTPHD